MANSIGSGLGGNIVSVSFINQPFPTGGGNQGTTDQPGTSTTLEPTTTILCEAFAVNGFYPLYSSEQCAIQVGDGTFHSHMLNGGLWYMPNGVDYWHGNYSTTSTTSEPTTSTTAEPTTSSTTTSTTQIPQFNDQEGISGFNSNEYFIRDGEIWSQGGNEFGQLGLGTISSNELEPTPTGFDGVVFLSGTEDRLFAIRYDGSVWVVGRNSNGELGVGNLEDATTWTQVFEGQESPTTTSTTSTTSSTTEDPTTTSTTSTTSTTTEEPTTTSTTSTTSTTTEEPTTSTSTTSTSTTSTTTEEPTTSSTTEEPTTSTSTTSTSTTSTTTEEPNYGYEADPDFVYPDDFSSAIGAHNIIHLVEYTNSRTGTAIVYPPGYIFQTTGGSGGSSIRAEDPLRPRETPYATGDNQSTGAWGWFQIADRGIKWDFARPIIEPYNFTLVDDPQNYTPQELYHKVESGDGAGYYQLTIDGLNSTGSSTWWQKVSDLDGNPVTSGEERSWINVIYQYLNYLYNHLILTASVNHDPTIILPMTERITHIGVSDRLGNNHYDLVNESSLVSSDRYVRT